MISRDEIFSPSFNSRLNRLIGMHNNSATYVPTARNGRERVDLIVERTLVRGDRVVSEEKVER